MEGPSRHALVRLTDGQSLPGVAQVAMHEGTYAAKAIVRKIRPIRRPANLA